MLEKMATFQIGANELNNLLPDDLVACFKNPNDASTHFALAQMLTG